MKIPTSRPGVTLDLDLSESTGSDSMEMGSGAACLDIDLNAVGKQHGHLCVPSFDPRLPPRQLRVPISSIKGQSAGPVITFLAGVHGDEFDGPLVLQQLSSILSAESIQGQVLLLPCLNLEGIKRTQRQMESDNQNLDLCFPGNQHGSDSERLAHEIVQRILRRSQWVVDLRSGGRSLRFSNCAAVRLENKASQQRRNEELMIAFGAPESVRLPPSQENTCLQSTVSALGIPYIQSIIDGGGGSKAESLEAVYRGCRNILRQCEIMQGSIELSATRLLEVRDTSYYVYAASSGIFEPCCTPGKEIWQGDALARIVTLDSAGQEPVTVKVPRNSVLLACHHGGPVIAGELIAVLAEEVSA